MLSIIFTCAFSVIFFFKQKTAYEMLRSLVGSEMCIRDSLYVGAYDNNMYALQAASGEFLWKYATQGGIVSKPAIFEGNLFFGSVSYTHLTLPTIYSV